MRGAAVFGGFRQYGNGIACICLILVALSGCGNGSATYTVTYDDNVPGETIGVPAESTDHAAGSTVTLSNIVPERTGFAFAGWSTAPDGMGVTYAAGSTLTMGSADVTLYAQWTTGPTYAIVYDDNVDGELIGVPTASTGYVAGTVVALSSSVPERTGFSFAGWSTAPDGMGITYAAGATLIMDAADLTLYAQWITGPTYTIVYEDNVDGELIGVPTASIGHAAGSVVTLSSSVPERTGFSFAGWSITSDGMGVTYAAGSTLTMGSADVTLYAQWTTGPTYAIVYDDNVDGELIGVPTASTGYVAGTVVALSSSVPEWTGFSFAGWNTAPDGMGVTYAAGATLIMDAADVTLYAQWTTGATYTIVYEDNVDGERIAVPTASTGYVAGTAVSLSSSVPERTGYAFAGWNTAPDGTGGTYAPGASLVIGTVDVILYAQWALELSVTYDANLPANATLSSGSAPIDDTGYVVGDTITVAGDNGMTVTDYRFTGWNGQADGQGTAYSDSFTITGDTTFYAQWAAVYTVTYHHNDSDGGTVPTDSNTYIAGESVTVLAHDGSLYRDDHHFDCWNTTAEGDGDHHHAHGSATLDMPDSHVTLYARWLRKHSIAYTDPSGESANLPGDGSFLEDDTSFTLDPAVPVRDGYVFNGWYTDAGFDGTRYMPGDVYTISGTTDVTFHANWVAARVLAATPAAVGARYTVRFDDNDGDDTTQVPNQTVGAGYTAVPPASLPVRPGYDFRGWFSDETLKRAYDFDTAVTRDTTLYAGWISRTTVHIVRFFNTRPFIDGQTIGEGGTAVEPTELVTYLDGWEFTHWREGLNPFGDVTRPYDFNTPVTDDVALYPKFHEGSVYTVRFDDNDGDTASDQVRSQRVIEGEAAAEPAPPILAAADFAGWYGDPGLTTPYDFNTAVDSDITLYGRWIDRWTAGDLAKATDNTDWYYFHATAGSEYEVAWDDSADGGGTYGGDVRVTAYRGDLATTVFAAVDDGYDGNARRFVATADERIYLKVEVGSGAAGSYALRFTRKYEVGDTGPGGGLIFYVDDGTYGTDTGGNVTWTYLEAAPASYDSHHYWGPYLTDTAFGNTARGKAIPGASRTGLGTGYENTRDFLMSETEGPQIDTNFHTEPIYYAAQQAASLGIHASTGVLFDDWFLPAADTLRAMYDDLYAADYDNDGTPDNIGEFFDAPGASFYWASTEDRDEGCDPRCPAGYSVYTNRAWSLDVGGNGFVGFREQKNAAYNVRAVRRF